MLVVLALAGLAVLGAVVVLAMGQGGELARVHADHPPLQMPTGRRLTGTDVALLHLPHGLWGYQVDVADEALHRLAYALSERDARVAALERQVAELRHRYEDHAEPSPWNGKPQPAFEDARAGSWDDLPVDSDDPGHAPQDSVGGEAGWAAPGVSDDERGSGVRDSGPSAKRQWWDDGGDGVEDEAEQPVPDAASDLAEAGADEAGQADGSGVRQEPGEPELTVRDDPRSVHGDARRAERKARDGSGKEAG